MSKAQVVLGRSRYKARSIVSKIYTISLSHISPKLTIILSIALKEIVTNEVGYFWCSTDIVSKTNSRNRYLLSVYYVQDIAMGKTDLNVCLMDFFFFKERDRDDRDRRKCREIILSRLPNQHWVREGLPENVIFSNNLSQEKEIEMKVNCNSKNYQE